MIKLVDTKDSKAVRNLNNIVELHEVMINQKRPEDAVAKFLEPGYVQHNPLAANGADSLAKFFSPIIKQRPLARWVPHRIIAVGDYVWVHSNFLNLFNDDPNDTGIAGADIFKMSADGRAIEHWDVLQPVGTPTNAAPWQAAGLKSKNSNGLF